MEIEKSEKLAFTLRINRAMANLTQAELAEKSGVSKCTITFIENGKIVPRAITLIKIADALGIEKNDLLRFIE